MRETPIPLTSSPGRAGIGPRILADRLVRNNAIYLTGSVVVGLVGYVFHFATGRLLGPTTYSVVAAMVSALSLLSLPSIVLQTTAARYASLLTARGESGAIRRLIVQLTLACLLGLVALVALVIVLAGPVARYLNLADTRLVYLLTLASAMALLVAITRGVLQGLSRFLVLSVNTLIDMCGRLVIAIGLILGGLGAAGAAIGLVAGPALAYAQSIFVLRHFSRPPPSAAPPLADIGRYTVSAIIAAAGTTYLLNVDVVLSKHFLSGQDSGIYAAGSVLGRVIYFLGMTVAAVMFPEVTRRHARGERHFAVVEKSLALLGILGGGLVVAYAVIPSVVVGPFGSGFARVGPYLALFATALGLFSLAVLLINYFLSVNSLRFIAPLLGACALDTLLITAFHSSPRQVVTMVLLSMAALLAALSGLYVADRVAAGTAAEGA